MSRTHITRDGEMLDLICARYYRGRQAGAVEIVLEANRRIRLGDYPPLLPRGLAIELPDIPEQIRRAPLVKLWD